MNEKNNYPPAKSALRKQMRQLLREHVRDASEICTELEKWLAARPELRTVAVYSPLPGEVNLNRTITALPELRWVFPRVTGEHLSFHTGENLTAGSFGILEPAEGSEEIAVRKIDAFICPGLAFDRKGGRLGRGRGFYDRMLDQARPDALKIGICYCFQMVDDTFPETHDIFMDHVIHDI